MAASRNAHSCGCGSSDTHSHKKRINIFDEIEKLTDYLDEMGEEEALRRLDEAIAEFEEKKS